MGRNRKIRLVENRGEGNAGRKITVDSPFTVPEARFMDEYVKTGDAKTAYENAGFEERYTKQRVDALLAQENIAYELKKRINQTKRKSVADASEVMEYFTSVMRGEKKDQFGLDPSLADRTKAAIELARRTVDLENRINGQPDNVIEIKLNWGRDDD